MKILLVDDDPVVRILVGEFLTSKGHTVETLEDGKSAIQTLTEPNALPDVVILDCMMPGVSGFDVLHNLRAVNTTLPVVMLSADKSNFKGQAEQPNETLEKPFALDTLEQTLDRLTR